MDFDSKISITKSLFDVKKNYCPIGLIPFLFLLACQSQPSGQLLNKSPVTNVNSIAPTATKLGLRMTQVGQNESPRISSDGNLVLFISKDRAAHANPQLYVYDVRTKKEKRITYQDGQVRDPLWSLDQKFIYYSSTTDEIKEKPLS